MKLGNQSTRTYLGHVQVAVFVLHANVAAQQFIGFVDRSTKGTLGRLGGNAQVGTKVYAKVVLILVCARAAVTLEEEEERVGGRLEYVRWVVLKENGGERGREWGRD